MTIENNEILTYGIINKINELYITNRKQFLKLNKQGEYSTVTHVPLHDGIIEDHLDGRYTVGVFAGKEISKFICFDIDMVDKSKLKWIYYLLMESLMEIGIDNKHIHVALSGNKGLHFLLFVKDGTSLKHFRYLFLETMKLIQEKVDISIKTRLHNDNELVLEITDICNIEFRPNGTSQGVKLELGINFKNKDKKANTCWFVEKDTLTPIKSQDYILGIEPMLKDEFLEIVDNLYDIHSEETELSSHKNLIMSEIKEPRSHKINKDENETIEFIVDLLQNGLYMSGTRHNSVLKIAKYFRYMGLELEQCQEELCNWMRKQDKKHYSSTLEGVLSECLRISKIVYEKEYSLVGHVENLKIYKSEMKEIIQIKNKNDKLLLYTMLIHSKRYALKSGVFYMTYQQMRDMCGIGRKGAIKSVERLEENGILEIVSRNVRQENDYKHKPNKYRINTNTIEDELIIEIDNSSSSIDYNELYYHSVIKSFTNEEIKHLPTRQYNEFTQFRNSMVG